MISWDAGPAHIISFSTEVYFFLWYGLELVELQYHWLEQELQACQSDKVSVCNIMYTHNVVLHEEFLIVWSLVFLVVELSQPLKIEFAIVSRFELSQLCLPW